MDIFFQSVNDTLELLRQVLPPMFAGLFGVEWLIQCGVMQKLEPLGKPLADVSRLPPATVPAFWASLGSLMTANAILARHHAENLITGRELVLAAVFNTVPLHFKETLTYQLPVVLPLLGLRLCLIYIAVFWLTGLLKLGFVIYQGRKNLVRGRESAGAPVGAGGVPEGQISIKDAFYKAFQLRWRLFFKMSLMLVLVTFLVQLAVNSGGLRSMEAVLSPFSAYFGLPASVIGPVSVYILSPLAGLTAMSALLKQHIITEYQAIVALLAGGLLMVPVTRLRGTLPRYVSVLGWGNGIRVLSITTLLSLLARGVMLLGVIVI